MHQLYRSRKLHMATLQQSDCANLLITSTSHKREGFKYLLCLPQSGISVALWEVNLCWRCVVHSSVGQWSSDLSWKTQSLLILRGDNYQTHSRQQWHKSRFDFLTAGRLQGMVPLPAHPAHPDHFSSLPRGRDVLFHNKTWNWLLSAPVNWT